jgi:hypothetical protein
VLLVHGQDPLTLSNAVHRVFRQQDQMLAIFGVESLDQALSRSISQQRFAMLLVGLCQSRSSSRASVFTACQLRRCRPSTE